MLEVTNLNAFFNDNSSAIEKKHRTDSADVKMWKSGKLFINDAVANAIDDGNDYTYLTLMADTVILSSVKLSAKSMTLKLSQKSGASGRTIAVKNSIFTVDDTRRLNSDECFITSKIKNDDGGNGIINAIIISKDERNQAQVLEHYKEIFQAQ